MRIITTKQLKEIPRRIIYSKAYNETTQYNMADTRTGKLVGRMYGNMEREFSGSTYYPTIDYYDSFFIHLLDIKEKRQGHGTAFINLAKNISKQNGGDGKIHLKASNCFDVKHPAQIFYRKLGFNSQYTEQLKMIDKAIKHNKKLDSKKLCDIPMYLPTNPKPVHYEPNILERILDLFKKKQK